MIGGELGVSGCNIDYTSASNIKSQVALLEYRNSIKKPCHQRRNPQMNIITTEQPDSNSENAYKNYVQFS